MSNLTLTRADLVAGAQIRKENEARFENDPVFLHARETLDKAIAAAPDTTYEIVPSIVQRNREAFAELKASLNTIRSSKSQSTSFFSESIPTTRGESTARVLVAVDCVNENIPVHNPPTSITGNIRPHNPESFVMAKKLFLQGTESSIDNHEGVFSGAQARIKLSSSANRETIDAILGLLGQMAPEKEDAKINFRVSDDGAYLIVTGASYIQRQDPLHKLVKVFNRSRDAESTVFGDNAVATDIFRLGTLRIDIPHDLGDFVSSGKEASWITLLEGVRIAAEIITRDNSAELLKADLVNLLLRGDYSSIGQVRNSIPMISAMEMVKDNTLNVKLAPAELCFALGVQDAAVPHRQIFSARLADDRSEDEIAPGTERGDYIRNYYTSTGLEEQLASLLSAKLKLGATSGRLLHVLKYALGFALTGSEGQLEPVLDMLLPLKDLVEEISSVSLLTPSGVVDFDIKGINSKLWSWLPSNAQEALEAAKPLAVAYSALVKNGEPGDDSDFAENTVDKIFTEVQTLFSGEFEELIESAVDSLFPDSSPRMLRKNKLPSIEKPVQKSCTIASPYVRSSAFDLALPEDLTSLDSAYKIGSSLIISAKVASAIGGGRYQTALRDLPDWENEQAKRNDPTVFGSEADEAEMRRQFNQFDEDGSGYLERTEAMSAFLCFYPDASPSDLLRRIRAADTNEDGKLDFVEYVKIAKAAMAAVREAESQ